MRVNEENFTTGNEEDIKPSYVDVEIDNHNKDAEAHPDVRKLISETQAFYQGAKDSVQGVADAAKISEGKAGEAAAIARQASDEAQKSEEAVKLYYPQIVDGEWHVYDEEKGCLAPSGVTATGAAPAKGVDYWTDEDKAEIKSYVDEAILGGEW